MELNCQILKRKIEPQKIELKPKQQETTCSKFKYPHNWVFLDLNTQKIWKPKLKRIPSVERCSSTPACDDEDIELNCQNFHVSHVAVSSKWKQQYFSLDGNVPLDVGDVDKLPL